jgi:PAS domain S-box-containing protein
MRQMLAEREEAQQAVEAERQQYQALFALAPDGYLVTDPRSLIHETNPAAARLLGMPPAFLVGKPLAGFVAPEEAPRFSQLLRALHTTPPPTPRGPDASSHRAGRPSWAN